MRSAGRSTWGTAAVKSLGGRGVLALLSLAGMACVVALWAAGAAAAAAPDRPTSRPPDRPTAGPSVPRSRGRRAFLPARVCECARIRVPLDWDRPNGRTISLAVIRHLASKPDERIGTLFINPGGPGSSGVGTGAGRSRRLRRHRRRPLRRRQLGSARHERQHPGALLPQPAERGASSGPANRSPPPTPPRSASRARPPTWPGAAARSAAGSCRTSRPPTRPATSTTCVSCSARRSSPTSASPTAPTSARPTPTCSPTGSGRCCSWASSTRPNARRGPRRGSASDVSSADEVFDQFLALCDGAGPERCALAGGGQTAAERVEQLFAQVRRAPIPAPGARPPLSSPEELSYGDLLLSQFEPLRAPSDVAGERGGARRRAAGATARRSRPGRAAPPRPRAGPARRPRRRSPAPTRPARQSVAGLAAGDRTTRADQPAPGPRAGLVAVGPLRLLAGARARTTTAGPGTPRPPTRSC